MGKFLNEVQTTDLSKFTYNLQPQRHEKMRNLQRKNERISELFLKRYLKDFLKETLGKISE